MNVEDESSGIETNVNEQKISFTVSIDNDIIITANCTATLENIPDSRKFICLTCKFEANRKKDMKQHKEDIHNLCSLCFSSFEAKKF